MSPSRRWFAACALWLSAALSFGAASSASVPVARYPQALATDIGAGQFIAEADGDAPIAGVQIFVAAGLDREGPKQSGISALVAECLERTPVDGVPLRDAVRDAGGSMSYTVDGRSVHYYFETDPDRLAPVVDLFAKALSKPDFSPATLAAARAALLSRAAENESNALAVAIAMFRQSYYLGGVGMPAGGMSTTLTALGPADAANFFAATYKRSAVSASAAGRLVPGLGAALQGLADALPAGTIAATQTRVRTIPADAPRIISHRDIAAPWIVVGFGAPSPASKDFGAMLVLESLLSGAFDRKSTTTLGFVEKSVGAFYLYDSSPASLVVYVNGSATDPSVALREVLVVSRSLSLRRLAAPTLEHFKTAAEGQFLTDSVNVSDRSYLLGTFASQGLGPDAINGALGALERTTADDVDRVAKKYLQRYIVALVLPRQSATR
jgi:predicted Zn-dependent peptidase